jgi:hypothetical protein
MFSIPAKPMILAELKSSPGARFSQSYLVRKNPTQIQTQFRAHVPSRDDDSDGEMKASNWHQKTNLWLSLASIDIASLLVATVARQHHVSNEDLARICRGLRYASQPVVS